MNFTSKSQMQFCTIVFIFLISSCGQKKVEPQFQVYLNSFYQEAELRGVDVRKKEISIHFGETAPGATAQCLLSNARPGSGGNEIIVNQEGWDDLADFSIKIEREILLFHELGHCLLGKGHLEKTINLCDQTDSKKTKWFKDVPLSIMKENNFIEPKIYNELRNYFLDQLFSVAPKPIPENIFKANSEADCLRQDSDASMAE